MKRSGRVGALGKSLAKEDELTLDPVGVLWYELWKLLFLLPLLTLLILFEKHYSIRILMIHGREKWRGFLSLDHFPGSCPLSQM